MDVIANKDQAPDMTQIKDYITGDAHQRWCSLIDYIENTFASKPKITFSVCAAKPGWNVKYKKSSRALCTLYPEKASFTALMVLGEKDRFSFDAVQSMYSEYLRDLYANSDLLGSSQWLMIKVTTDEILEDVKKLMHLKLGK